MHCCLSHKRSAGDVKPFAADGCSPRSRWQHGMPRHFGHCRGIVEINKLTGSRRGHHDCENRPSMKAVSCFEGNLSVVELPTPQPAAGQLLLEVRRCGICGSDLHAKDHADELAEVTAATGYADFMRASTPVVMGHEFLRRGRRARPRGCQGVQAQHLRFVFGYTPLEFHDTLHMLADGKLDASALVTGTVGLEGVDAAFRALGDPERHAKILIDPSSPAKTV